MEAGDQGSTHLDFHKIMVRKQFHAADFTANLELIPSTLKWRFIIALLNTPLAVPAQWNLLLWTFPTGFLSWQEVVPAPYICFLLWSLLLIYQVPTPSEWIRQALPFFEKFCNDQSFQNTKVQCTCRKVHKPLKYSSMNYHKMNTSVWPPLK